jgi:DNA-binding transcriptional LysR family regulator
VSANIGFAAFHLYTAVIAYQSSGGISAFLTLAMPMLSEIYWCGKPAGMLRVTAPPPAGDFFLASAVPRFLAHYPEISLDLSFTDALTDIVAERFDAGIRIGERIERDMIAVRVTDELPLVVAGSPAYFA